MAWGCIWGASLYVFWSPGGAYVAGNAEGKVEGNAEGNAGGFFGPLFVYLSCSTFMNQLLIN